MFMFLKEIFMLMVQMNKLSMCELFQELLPHYKLHYYKTQKNEARTD